MKIKVTATDDENGASEPVKTPHNSLFEKTFGNVKNVRAFLKKELPASVRRHLDLRKIAIEPTSYVSSKLRPFRSDVVIRVGLKGKGRKEGKEKGIYQNLYPIRA